MQALTAQLQRLQLAQVVLPHHGIAGGWTKMMEKSRTRPSVALVRVLVQGEMLLSQRRARYRGSRLQFRLLSLLRA